MQPGDKRRRVSPRFMGFGVLGPLGAIGERLGQRHPLEDFDPEAFQHGAYGNAGSSADPDEDPAWTPPPRPG